MQANMGLMCRVWLLIMPTWVCSAIAFTYWSYER